jgi:hypothetical protein
MKRDLMRESINGIMFAGSLFAMIFIGMLL